MTVEIFYHFEKTRRNGIVPAFITTFFEKETNQFLQLSNHNSAEYGSVLWSFTEVYKTIYGSKILINAEYII